MKIMSCIVHSAHPRSRVSAILQPLCPRVLRAYQHLLFHLTLSRQETCRRNRMRSDAHCTTPIRSLHHHVKKARDWLYRSRSSHWYNKKGECGRRLRLLHREIRHQHLDRRGVALRSQMKLENLKILVTIQEAAPEQH